MSLYRWFAIFIMLLISWHGLNVKAEARVVECRLRCELNNRSGIEKRDWLVRFEYDSDGKELTRKYFVTDASAEELPFATLIHVSSGNVTLLGSDSRVLQRGLDHFLLRPGFPVSVDALPVASAGSSRPCSDMREAQGLKFRRSFTLTVQDISSLEAKRRGYIDDYSGIANSLLIYKLVDASGKQVILQIREKEAEMWLYEESDFRRTWRQN